MKITVETLKELGFKEMPSGNWIKTTTGGNAELVEPSLVAKPELPPVPFKTMNRIPKPRLNKTETKACALLEARGHKVWKQAITLALDPPFRSYRADLAFMDCGTLNLIEAKAPHRFAKAGIAKAAVAAKTYPQFVFRLFMWTKNGFHESILSP